MENMQVLLDYSNAYQEYDNYMKEKQNTPTREKTKKNNAILKSANKNLTDFKNAIETRQKEYEQQLRLSKQLDSDLEELSKDISYYSECEDEEFTQRQYEDMVKEAKRIMSQNDKIRKILEELAQNIEKQEAKLMNFLVSIRDAQKNVEELTAKYKEEQLVKDDRQTELETRIKELEKSIPSDVLEEFRKVKTNRPKPVAVYENGRCSGCNMQLPPLYSGRIQNEKIVKCEHCGRILVVI